MTSTERPPVRHAPTPTAASRWPWALAGLGAGVLGLGLAEVVAGIVQPSAAPVVAVGDAFVDVVPAWLKTAAIAAFGTYDKLVLLVGAGLTVGVLAAVAGVLSRRRPLQAQWLVLGLGAVAALAAATRPDAGMLSVLPSLVGALAAAMVLTRISARSRAHAARTAAAPRAHDRDGAPDAAWDGAPAGDPARGGDPDGTPGGTRDGDPARDPAGDPARRAVLVGSALAGAVGLVAAAAGRLVAGALHAADESRAAVRLPAPQVPAPALPGGVEVGVPGVAPFRVPNADFYRIDTALVVPSVRAGDWTLRIHGMVEREVELDYAALLAQPLVERDITLACVSNEVGGDLIGNARWLGLPIAPLLREAGPLPDADMVLSTSADGWTASTPLQVLTDGRDALLAVAMNGEPLPVEHGFPVRMVVPGLYGYVSATKWVVDLEVTRFDRRQAYWTPRGWSERGPVKTQSRIDVPRDRARVRAGAVAVAGVAWAQHRGVRAVEVRVDGGPWQPARLAAEASIDTWRQWVFSWQAAPGPHELQVRATDATGEQQTGDQAPVEPDGATGWHTIAVDVT